MHILKHHIRNTKCVQKRVNVNNGRWKHICRINSSKRIKNDFDSDSSGSNDRIYWFRMLSLRHRSFIINQNDYIQWLLLLVFVIFSASLSGSDNFVPFDTLEGNAANS